MKNQYETTDRTRQSPIMLQLPEFDKLLREVRTIKIVATGATVFIGIATMALLWMIGEVVG